MASDLRIGVVVGVFGDPSWHDLALRRAMKSIDRQTRPPDASRLVNAGSLAEARNRGAEQLKVDLLVFLDADDQLDPGYLAAMEAAYEPRTLLQPQTLGVYRNGTEDPEPCFIAPALSIMERNHLVIGTAVERDLFLDVGGFLERPILEDWCLWIRCLVAGVAQKQVADAVYRVHVEPDSRNVRSHKVMVDTYRKIRARYLQAAKDAGLA
jgi:glycosyltransferase involved in cell wall biosynthesis